MTIPVNAGHHLKVVKNQPVSILLYQQILWHSWYIVENIDLNEKKITIKIIGASNTDP